MTETDAHTIREGVKRAVPIGIAAAAFGASFGVLAREAGMGAVAPLVMSATTFAGSAQFAAAAVLDAGGGVLAAVGAAVLLNARYAPISISVAPAFRGPTAARLVQSQLIVDESWALSQTGGGRASRPLLVGTGILLFVGWVGGTAVGVFAGGFIGEPERLGLDAAFPALFLALLVGQLGSRRALAAALIAAAIAVALVPIAPPGVPIIASAAACLVGLARR